VRLVFSTMSVHDKRAPRSKIASDPNRVLIERALAMGIPMSRVAQRFGYSMPAIQRYRDRMPQQLKAAIVAAALKPKETDLDQLRIDESEGILGNLAHQRARLLMCQDECMEAGAVEQVARLSGVIHKNIELTGRYLGLFAQHHVSSQVNIMVSEDYLRLRQALTMALRPFPEARRAVAEALHRIEGEIAGKMVDQAAKQPPRPSLKTIDLEPESATAGVEGRTSHQFGQNQRT
jgi:hypothetical protein